MPGNALWKLAALAFALAAPAGSLWLTMWWAAGTGPFMAERGPYLVRGSLAALALTLAVAGVFLWRRGRASSPLELFLLWLGSAFPFAFAFAFVALNDVPLRSALQLSPYLGDAVLYGLALAAVAGLLLAHVWRRWRA